MNILDSQMKHMKEMERFHRAAGVIQKVFRGFNARRKVKMMRETRGKRESEERQLDEEKERKRLRELEEKDLKLQMLIMRQRGVMETQERRLYLTERVTARNIDKYLQQSEAQAALTIQSHWRGCKAKQKFESQKESLKRIKAVVTLQRWTRRCLAKVDQKRALRGKKLWSAEGMSEYRRAELQQKIEEFRERMYVKPSRSRVEDELHFNRAQDLLKQQIQMCRIRAKADVRRDTLMAKMDVDCEFLKDLPSLDDALSDDVISKFLNPLAPVALSGKKAHLDCVAQEKMPWYKRLDSNQEIDFEDTYSIRSNIERQIDKIVKY